MTPELVEDAIYAKLAYQPSLISTMIVEDQKDLVLVDSGLPCDTFNVIFRSQLQEKNVEERITSVTRYFRERKYPACWWLGPSSSPTNLGQLLEKHGYLYEESSLGLAADISNISYTETLLDNITIQQVLDTEGLNDFTSVMVEFFAEHVGPQAATVYDEYYKLAAQLGFNASSPFQYFIAYSERKPISIGTYLLHNGIAAFSDLITLPAYRRKGIGQALVIKQIKHVLDLGVRWAVASAGSASQGICTRLGFKKYCEFATYQLPIPQ